MVQEASLATPGSASWWEQTRNPPKRRGRPPMELARIVDASLEVLDEGDAGEYSIRNVATRLGSSTATLYRRVDGRPGLDALIVDAILGEALNEAASSSTGEWQDTLIGIANATFAALARHPRAVPLVAASVPSGPNAVALRERAIECLLREGFSPKLAARTYTSAGHYTVGFGLQLMFDPARAEHVNLPPASARVASHLDAELRDEFLFGLTMMLQGVDASRKRSNGTERGSTRAPAT